MPLLSLRTSTSSPRRVTLSSSAPVIHAARRHISSQSLLEGARELVILHQGSEYHLRLTRNDKLMLTK